MALLFLDLKERPNIPISFPLIGGLDWWLIGEGMVSHLPPNTICPNQAEFGGARLPSVQGPIKLRPVQHRRALREAQDDQRVVDFQKLLVCDMAVVVKFNGIPFWLVGAFTTHVRLPILVVGLGCSLGGRGFDPDPHQRHKRALQKDTNPKSGP